MVVGRLLERAGDPLLRLRHADPDQVHLGVAAACAPPRAMIDARRSAAATYRPFKRISADGQRRRRRS